MTPPKRPGCPIPERRKFYTGQKRGRRPPPELAGLDQDQLDDRNKRIWDAVFSTMLQLAEVPTGHELAPGHGDADRAYRDARVAAVMVCRDTYKVPWSRAVELAGVHHSQIASAIRLAGVTRGGRIADLVARWPDSPGPMRVERQDTTQTDITLEAARALQELCSVTGHHPLAVVSAAVLVACGRLQGDV